jgi:hypothetical protein
MTDPQPPADDPHAPPAWAEGGVATRLATSVSSRGIDPEPDDAGVPFALGFWNPWMLVVIMALVVMITLHELGHYLTAKRAGMKVTEFFLFFGPKVWSIKRGETEYGIKCIPAGAYVKIIGMHNLEEVPAADEGRTYRQKSFGRRLSVAVAGSAMHFVLALILIFPAARSTRPSRPAPGRSPMSATARGRPWLASNPATRSPASTATASRPLPTSGPSPATSRARRCP